MVKRGLEAILRVGSRHWWRERMVKRSPEAVFRLDRATGGAIGWLIGVLRRFLGWIAPLVARSVGETGSCGGFWAGSRHWWRDRVVKRGPEAVFRLGSRHRWRDRSVKRGLEAILRVGSRHQWRERSVKRVLRGFFGSDRATGGAIGW